MVVWELVELVLLGYGIYVGLEKVVEVMVCCVGSFMGGIVVFFNFFENGVYVFGFV